MYKNADEIIAMKKEHMLPCLYHFYKNPPVIVKGSMQYLFDSAGKQYLDCYSGVTVLNCGHCNPEIIEPVIEQIYTLQHTTTIYLTEPIVTLAQRLISFIGASLKKVFFVNSGSEANEGALLLAKLYTGKTGFIAVTGGLHGRTSLTMNLTGLDMWRTDPDIRDNVHFVPRPTCTSCSDTCDCIKTVEETIVRHGNIAAFIVEPIQGNGGIFMFPDGYFYHLKKLLDKHNILLIFDEVQTGFCRTGKRFGFKHYGVEPDILVMAKALGSGFPIGAFSSTDKIAQCYTRPGASTTGGNPVSARAGIAVLDYILKHKLDQKCAELGQYFKERLIGFQQKYSYIAEVRGAGLMLGVELNDGTTPLTAETDRLLEGLKDKGFLAGKTGAGRNVLTFMPPLVVTKTDIDNLCTALEQEFDSICTVSA
ncbi:MAG: aspartate aminotransferase family protein [Candidatus Auribacter fodinae]|jgi:4-aminobutyrate aminotransferase/4-aminobutyrate aminotransferase/(S)-3-amino-2-methylpropionate transaminase|uniref:alanine--glyoxylate transaminase n=1 Tax=Candidatus Auribacter fodinae TaxID=2093366 RepID=A0A3A4RAW3_9BACT|nr:MAG: aspartate aminotransferase family protein [Candidatus Auribacter fodinae]